ncbi:hypothetical protein OHC33_011007 [Knufia fluminis]|uniref:Uncharacterized protein n=1 Tax=Knufia fluminis TaxID=191047 RepID=A0AAN8EXG5_9EURO|nr:hypothetical protein OHC33_011007 [Knufia fluminis]
MSYGFDNKRDEAYMEGPLSGATTTLMRVAGGWGNISGPSIFMLRSLVAGSTTAMSFGLTGATISAVIFRTATIPFIISTSIGFIVGVVGFYKDCIAKASISLDLYPKILQLHLDQNFPWRGFRTWPIKDFRTAEFARSWTLKSMLLVSWLTAQPALDQIFEAKEKALIAEACARPDNVDETARETVYGEEHAKF